MPIRRAPLSLLEAVRRGELERCQHRLAQAVQRESQLARAAEVLEVGHREILEAIALHRQRQATAMDRAASVAEYVALDREGVDLRGRLARSTHERDRTRAALSAEQRRVAALRRELEGALSVSRSVEEKHRAERLVAERSLADRREEAASEGRAGTTVRWGDAPSVVNGSRRLR